MSEPRVAVFYRGALLSRACPQGHRNLKETIEVGNGQTVITKECGTCGQFFSRTVLPAEQPERLERTADPV
jgi:hypothetical protein